MNAQKKRFEYDIERARVRRVIKDEIRTALLELSTDDAVTLLAEIWVELDNASQLADGLPTIPKPKTEPST